MFKYLLLLAPLSFVLSQALFADLNNEELEFNTRGQEVERPVQEESTLDQQNEIMDAEEYDDDYYNVADPRRLNAEGYHYHPGGVYHEGYDHPEGAYRGGYTHPGGIYHGGHTHSEEAHHGEEIHRRGGRR